MSTIQEIEEKVKRHTEYLQTVGFKDFLEEAFRGKKPEDLTEEDFRRTLGDYWILVNEHANLIHNWYDRDVFLKKAQRNMIKMMGIEND